MPSGAFATARMRGLAVTQYVVLAFVGVLLLFPPAAAQVQSPQAWQFISMQELSHMPPYSGATSDYSYNPQPANQSFVLLNFGEKLLTVKSALTEQQPGD